MHKKNNSKNRSRFRKCVMSASLLAAGITSVATASTLGNIPINAPAQRIGVPMPISVEHIGSGIGSAGLDWDVALSTVKWSDSSLAFKKPRWENSAGNATGSDTVVQGPMPYQVSVSLADMPVSLVYDSMNRWIGRDEGELVELAYDSVNDHFTLAMNSHKYIFEKLSAVGDDGSWYLQTVQDWQGANQVKFSYQVDARQHVGNVNGFAAEVLLDKVEYNHKIIAGVEDTSCPKHRIDFSYENWDGSADTDPDKLEAHLQHDGSGFYITKSKLTDVKIQALEGSDCSGGYATLHKTTPMYEGTTDNEYGVPRIIGYDMESDLADPDTDDSDWATDAHYMKGPRYSYGVLSKEDDQGRGLYIRYTGNQTVSSSGLSTALNTPLQGDEAIDYSESMILPEVIIDRSIGDNCLSGGDSFLQEVNWYPNDEPGRMTTDVCPSFSIDKLYQTVVDMTGDGQPDVVYHENGTLMLQENITVDENTFSYATAMPLFNNILNDGGIALDVLGYTATMAIKKGWAEREIFLGSSSGQFVTMVDYNQDGRVDFLDARSADKWKLFLNTPPETAGCSVSGPICWQYYEIDIRKERDALRDRFAANEMYPSKLGWLGGDTHLPLSYAVNGDANVWLKQFFSVDEDSNGYDYTITLQDTVISHLDDGPLGSVASTSNNSFELMTLEDFNGDGFVDIISAVTPPTVTRHTSAVEWDDYGPYPDNIWNFDDNYATWEGAQGYWRIWDLGISGPSTNTVEVFYNHMGARLLSNSHDYRLASPYRGPHNTGALNCAALTEWSHDGYVCGLLDANSDGLLDSIFNHGPSERVALLGNGMGFETTQMSLPEFDVHYDFNQAHPVCPGPGLRGDDYNNVDETTLATEALGSHNASGVYEYRVSSNYGDFNSDGVLDAKSGVGTGTYFGRDIFYMPGDDDPDGTRVENRYDLTNYTNNRVSKCIVDNHGTYLGRFTRTTRKFIDIDSDGYLDEVSMVNGALKYKRIVTPETQTSSSIPNKVYEANKIIKVQAPNSVSGSTILYTYANAKMTGSIDNYGGIDDSVHRVPGPEIVLSETEGEYGTTHNRYGDIWMVFDPIANGFVSTGYGKTVTARGVVDSANPDFFKEASVLISQRKFSKNQIALDGAANDTELATMFQVASSNSYAGRLPTNISQYLQAHSGFVNKLEPDTRRAQLEYGIVSNWKVSTTATSYALQLDCRAIANPYAAQSATDSSNNPGICSWIDRDYTVTTVNATGDGIDFAAPIKLSALETRTEVEAVDDYGRITRVHYYNDLHDLAGYDDVCETITYATPASSTDPLITLTTQHTLDDCDGDNTGEKKLLSSASMFYDNLGAGSYSQGLLTSSQATRLDIQTGDTVAHNPVMSSPSVRYNALSQPIQSVMNSVDINGHGQVTTVTIDLDHDFSLLALSTHTQGSDAMFEPKSGVVTYDPTSLLVTQSAVGYLDDVNLRTVKHVVYDDMGRIIQAGIQGPGDAQPTLMSVVEFFGDDASGFFPKKVKTRSFRDGIAWSYDWASAAQPSEADHEVWDTTTFDGVGRIESAVSEKMVDGMLTQYHSGHVMYDSLGRVVYQSDSLLPGENNANGLQGITYVYNHRGELECTVRAAGYQQNLPTVSFAHNGVPFTFPASDDMEERQVSCADTQIIAHKMIQRRFDPDALLPGSNTFGIAKETERTALGRTLQQRLIYTDGTVMNRMSYGYDHAGNMTSQVRYRDPAKASSATETWTWHYDSTGKVLSKQQGITPAEYTLYDLKGGIFETYHNENGARIRTLLEFDSLGRIENQEMHRCSVATDPATCALILETQLTHHYDQAVAGHPADTYVLGRLASSHRYDVNGNRRLLTQYGYDKYGRQDQTFFHNEASDVYSDQVVFSGFGPVQNVTQTSPNGAESLTYQYHDLGPVSAVVRNGVNLFTADAIDHRGRYLQVSFENGAVENFNYGARGTKEMLQSHTVTINGVANTTTYDYDILGRTTSLTSDIVESTYQFDAMGRLASFSDAKVLVDGGPFTQNYFYDGLGNLYGIAGNSGEHWVAKPDSNDLDRFCEYQNGGVAIATLPTPSTTCNVQYNAAGDMTSFDGRTLYYNDAGQLTRIDDGNSYVEYQYGVSGVSCLTMGGGAEQGQECYYGGMRKRPMGGTDTIEYLFALPVGSTSIRENGEVIYSHGSDQEGLKNSNAVGAENQQRLVMPYGQIRDDQGAFPGDNNYTPEAFNAGRHFSELGMSQVGARTYIPKIGRFAQRDPILHVGLNLQSSPYAFPLDPVNMHDRSGLGHGTETNGGGTSTGGNGGIGGCRNDCTGVSTSDSAAGWSNLGGWFADGGRAICRGFGKCQGPKPPKKPKLGANSKVPTTGGISTNQACSRCYSSHHEASSLDKYSNLVPLSPEEQAFADLKRSWGPFWWPKVGDIQVKFVSTPYGEMHDLYEWTQDGLVYTPWQEANPSVTSSSVGSGFARPGVFDSINGKAYIHGYDASQVDRARELVSSEAIQITMKELPAWGEGYITVLTTIMPMGGVTVSGMTRGTLRGAFTIPRASRANAVLMGNQAPRITGYGIGRPVVAHRADRSMYLFGSDPAFAAAAAAKGNGGLYTISAHGMHAVESGGVVKNYIAVPQVGGGFSLATPQQFAAHVARDIPASAKFVRLNVCFQGGACASHLSKATGRSVAHGGKSAVAIGTTSGVSSPVLKMPGLNTAYSNGWQVTTPSGTTTVLPRGPWETIRHSDPIIQ